MSITTGTGLISGINITSIVDQLMAIEARPRDILTARQTTVNAQREEMGAIAAQIMSLRSTVIAMRFKAQLSAASATSSNPDLIAATASNGALPGTYQFRVGRLASTQQLVSQGYASTAATLQAGTITVQSAQARLTDDTSLAVLNGQQGVRAGSIRITDRSGASAVVDLSMAMTTSDVLDAINGASGINVEATTSGGRLVLQDLTGQSVGNLMVAEVSRGATAANLGILQSVAANTLTGTDLVSVNAATSLGLLNNGLGVQNVVGQSDFRVALRDGTTFDVNLDSAKTLGQVVDAINAASQASANPGALVASINTAGDGLQLVDSSAGGNLTVTALNGSRAAQDLGIIGSQSSGTITGSALVADLGGVLLSRLNGGSGVARGQFTITDREGTASTIDLRGASTITDVLAAINDPAVTAKVSARLSDSGNGLVITDESSGAGHLIIADLDSTTAADLKITVDADVTEKSSGALNRQFMSEQTLLSSLKGGLGASRGKFIITNSLGQKSTVDLATAGATSLGDVITAINAAGLSVTAAINPSGDGLRLTDTAGGASALLVEDTVGTSAQDLNIAGSAASGATYVDGATQKTIEVLGTDTLATLAAKLSAAKAGLQASTLSDGGSIDPYRLSLVADRSGAGGALLVDAGTTGLSLSQLIRGNNAVLAIGDGQSSAPLLVSSSSNTVTRMVDNVSLELKAADLAKTVTITVATDINAVVANLSQLVTGFNDVMTKITEDTKYDAKTMKSAILQGDATVMNARQSLFSLVFSKFTGTGSQFSSLSALGFSVEAGNQLKFDESKFRQVFQSSPEEVRKLLNDTTNGVLVKLDKRLESLGQIGFGTLAVKATQLQRSSDMYTASIENMTKLLDQKRERLTLSFTNMEAALAKMQSQQSALTNLASLVANYTSSSS